MEGFLAGPSLALVTVALFGIWTYVGYNTVIFLAGLGAISKEYYEAAQIDGAGTWQSFRYITLPLLTPTAFFCTVTSVIGAAQVFDNAWVLTRGGPKVATQLIALYIYEVGFKGFEMGYAATVSLTLLIILLLLTLFQFWFSKKWVNYE